MSSDLAIIAHDISKAFRIYARPEDRLMELASIGRIKRHREFQALRGVNLEVRRGETVGIIGRNGCGKSTLLQIICGILPPTSGEIKTNGRIAALLELGAGFNGEFTGRENVYLNGGILGLTRAEMDSRLEAIFCFADIGDFIDRPVKTYSSGMFVRLAFATAINVDPDILVVDEALSVGDEAFQRKCFARIEQIKQRGSTILFVSHGAQTIVQLCDRAILLDGGEMLIDGAPKAVVHHYQRLAHASPDGAAEIRRRILTAEAESPGQELAGQGPVSPTVISTDTAIAPRPLSSDTTDPAEHFDPDTVSQSASRHEKCGAAIGRTRLLTLSGNEVNVIRRGRRFRFEYEVDFDRNADQVGFGLGLTTLAGLQLAGWAARANRVASIARATRYIASFEFQCSLMPGTYFFTCHVRGTVAGEEQTMDRIADAFMFRVSDDGDRNATGLVEIGIIASASQTDGGV
ncbi:ABC transporter ATP-binding protein [Phreatobacter aquaticus]|uniref:ABC transporter ATP-binding protein n=1 Tax=Phreatobacter aquaticus TaxID=2570229 RepID=A0A4D7QW34_9HYPH|nr:ABC transporter ATP-binding protein [Phreatobacter aquaticus]QCK88172.1 ABC transporter ATP-binding protein [Phreatobacter aquaticus]